MAGGVNLEDGLSIPVVYVDHTMHDVTVLMAPRD